MQLAVECQPTRTTARRRRRIAEALHGKVEATVRARSRRVAPERPRDPNAPPTTGGAPGRPRQEARRKAGHATTPRPPDAAIRKRTAREGAPPPPPPLYPTPDETRAHASKPTRTPTPTEEPTASERGEERNRPGRAVGLAQPVPFPVPLRAPARLAQHSEPVLVPKLRIQFADFPYLHCCID